MFEGRLNAAFNEGSSKRERFRAKSRSVAFAACDRDHNLRRKNLCGRAGGRAAARKRATK
jgi:hypothetical protein